MALIEGLARFVLPTSVLFQIGMGSLIVLAGRLSPVRVAAATVLGLNAAQQLRIWAQPGVAASWAGAWGGLDFVILLSVAFLLSQFPQPAGGHRGQVRATYAWAIATPLVYLGILFNGERVHSIDGFGLPENHLVFILHSLCWVLLAAAAAFHTVRHTLGREPGALRTQALLVVLALTAGPSEILSQSLKHAVDDLGRNVFFAADLGYVIFRALELVALLFLFYATIQALVFGLRERDRGGLVVGTILLLAASPVLVSFINGPSGAYVYQLPSEFFTFGMRPLLLGAALLRFDLFQVPRPIRRATLPIVIVAFALITFTLVLLILDAAAWQRDTIPAGEALLAGAVVGILAYVARHPLADLMRVNKAAHEDEALERLRRYRIELESLEDPKAPDAAIHLARFRERWDITNQQHNALVSVLDGNVVLPESALVGAGPGDQVGGQFEIVHLLGKGGQGRVFLARDLQDDREVVVKEVAHRWQDRSEHARLSLRREAAAAQRVSSPHVASVLTLVEERWQVYLVREYVEGETLDERVTTHGPLPPREAATVLEGVALALGAVHEAGIVHGDVKPANIIIDARGRAVLIDLGASHAVAVEGSRSITLPRDGGGEAPAVTVAWASPEQLDGRPVDPASDVYQMALLIAFLLTAERPSVGATGPGWIDGLHGLDGPARGVLRSAVDPDPDQRPRSCKALRDALVDVLPAATSRRGT